MTIEVINPQHGLPYLVHRPDVPNVPPAWQAEMARLLASMDDDPMVATSTPTPPPVSHVRQCRHHGGTHGERGSLLQPGSETTSTAKVG